MKKILTTNIVFLVLLGCNLDPCKTALKVDPKVAEACASETGEDGDVDSPVERLCLNSWDFNISPIDNGSPQLCIYGDQAWGDPSPNQWQALTENDCDSRVRDWPCGRSWTDPWSEDSECYICNLPLWNTYVTYPDWTNESWLMCADAGEGQYYYHLYYPAYYNTSGAQVQASPAWGTEISCDYDDFPAGWCEPVLLSPYQKYNPNEFTLAFGEWTCRCDSDIDCQTGAVCNAGAVLDGLVPKFTLCTWDDGSGTNNGPAPEGPEVYGLVRWEEGIRIYSGNEIVITPSFLVSMLGLVDGNPVGLMNDDQEIDIATGEILHCGPNSLCGHLRLRIGDDIWYPTTVLTDIMSGPVTMAVEHSTGSVTYYTISIDFDGQL